VQELKVIADFYDFALWLTRHIEKFPRHHRYSLGLYMEQQLYTILKSLIRAKYTKDRTGMLPDGQINVARPDETGRLRSRRPRPAAVSRTASYDM
jgi:hypothetical protein